MSLNEDQKKFLKQSKLFEGVEPHVIELVAKAEDTLWETREHGEILLAQGSTTEHSWLLVHGIVAVRRREAENNQEVHWGFRRPIEQFIGTLSIAETEADTTHSVFSSMCDLIRIHSETMLSAMQLSRRLIRNMSRSHAYRFEAATLRAELARSLKPVQKVAAILVEAGMAVQANLDMNYAQVSPLSLTHEELANLAGMSKQTLSRSVLPQLQKYLIQPQRGQIILSDAEAIRAEFINHITFRGGV